MSSCSKAARRCKAVLKCRVGVLGQCGVQGAMHNTASMDSVVQCMHSLEAGLEWVQEHSCGGGAEDRACGTELQGVDNLVGAGLHTVVGMVGVRLINCNLVPGLGALAWRIREKITSLLNTKLVASNGSMQSSWECAPALLRAVHPPPGTEVPPIACPVFLVRGVHVNSSPLPDNSVSLELKDNVMTKSPHHMNLSFLDECILIPDGNEYEKGAQGRLLPFGSYFKVAINFAQVNRRNVRNNSFQEEKCGIHVNKNKVPALLEVKISEHSDSTPPKEKVGNVVVAKGAGHGSEIEGGSQIPLRKGRWRLGSDDGVDCIDDRATPAMREGVETMEDCCWPKEIWEEMGQRCGLSEGGIWWQCWEPWMCSGGVARRAGKEDDQPLGTAARLRMQGHVSGTLQERNATIMQLEEEIMQLNRRLMALTHVSTNEIGRLAAKVESHQAQNQKELVQCWAQCEELIMKNAQLVEVGNVSEELLMFRKEYKRLKADILTTRVEA
ncbi:hypothetical protein B0H17DRAFT_1138256 [Mycena rosella]|uniref:Uncharacterized protein n=1 Tax=Mycena rosella TaxID=1033263 RepID=A0AAD7D791_MYCRO|nr:hypothetical protein B0H17DRAFT_1138256 [Mycena rosella]